MAVIGTLRAELSASVAKFEKDMGRAAQSVKRTAAEMTRVGNDFRKVGSQLQSAGQALTKTITLPLAAAGAAVAKVGIDFESSFAGIRKTVNATEPEFRALAQGFRNLAKEIPISVNELNRIGEAAGQLGIKQKDILGFSKVMAELGVATNLSATEAATAIARIQSIFNASGQDTDRFGSAVVALGNNFATTESEIVEFATRIAGAGKVVGLSQADVLGFGAALSSVGVEAEAGGTAISKILVELANAAASGGSKLTELAAVAGMTGEEFSKAFKDNAALATTSFIEGLGRITESGGNVFKTLEDLGLVEVRLQRALLSSAGAGDLLRRSLDLSSTAWQQNAALTKEAEQRFATTASQLTILWNRIKDVGITLFTSLKPAIDAAIVAVGKLLPYVESLAKTFGALPGSVQLAIISALAFAAALGPVLIVAGQVVSAISTLTLAFGKGGIGTRVLVAGLDAAKTALGGFRAVLDGTALAQWGTRLTSVTAFVTRFGGVITGLISGGFAPLVGMLQTAAAGFVTLLNPITLTIAAIAAVGLAVVALTGHWDDLKAGVSTLIQVAQDAGTVLWFLAKSVIGDLISGLVDLGRWIGSGIVSGFQSLMAAAAELGRWVLDLAAAVGGPLIDAFREWVAWVKDHIPGWLVALVGKVTDLAKATKDMAVEGVSSLHEYAEAVRQAGETAAGAFEKAKEGMASYGADLQQRALPAVMSAEQALALLNQQLQGVGAAAAKADGFQGLTASLAAARAELDKLSPDKVRALTEAVKSGAFTMKELQERTGLSEAALKLFTDRVQDVKKSASIFDDLRKQIKEVTVALTEASQSGAPIEFVKRQFGSAIQDIVEQARILGKEVPQIIQDAFLKITIADAMKKVLEDIEDVQKRMADRLKSDLQRQNQIVIAGLSARVAAERNASNIRAKASLTEFEYQKRIILQEQQAKKDALEGTVEDNAEALRAIDDETEARMSEASATWREKLAEMNAATNSWGNLTRKWLEGIPALMQRAFEGGGGFSGALKSMFSGIGSDIGTKLFGDLAAKMSNGLASLFGTGVTEALGTIIPGLGGVIGSLAGPLISKLGSLIKGAPEWKKLQKDIGRDFGVAITDALAKQIEADSKQFGRQAAGILNLDAIIDAAGGLKSDNIAKFTAKMRDAFSLLGTGAISGAQAATILDKNFQAFADNWLKKGPLISRELVEIVQLTRSAGVESKAVGEFIKGQVSNNIIAGLQAFTEPSKAAADSIAEIKQKMQDLKEENNELFENAGSGRLSAADEKRAADLEQQWQLLKKQLETQEKLASATSVTSQAAADGLAATVAVAFSELQRSGTPILEIAKQLQPIVSQLGSQFEAAGFQGGAAFDKIRGLVALAADEIAGPALQAATGLGQALAGLSNIGQLDQGTFSGLTEQIRSTFDTLVAQGQDGDQVMRALQQPLQTIYELASQFGFAVDEGTQALLDQAQAAGVVGEQQKPVQQQMLDATLAIKDAVSGLAEVFGVVLPDRVGAGTAAVQNGSKQMADAVAKVGDGAKTAADAIRNDLPAATSAVSDRIKKDLGGSADAIQKAFEELSGQVGDDLSGTSQETRQVIEAVIRKMEEQFGGLPDEAKDAASMISGELSKIRVPVINIPITFDPPPMWDPTRNGGVAGGGPAPELEEFKEGTRGLRDFGAATVAVLHGREAVIPEDEYKSLVTAAAAGVSADVATEAGGDVKVEMHFHGFMTDGASVRRAVDQLMPELKEAIKRDEAGIRRAVRRVSR